MSAECATCAHAARSRLAVIRTRLERATAGPWHHDTAKNDEHDHDSPDLVCDHVQGNTIARCYPGDVDDDKQSNQDHRNAAFIAHAREDVEWLLNQLTQEQNA